MKNIFRDVLSGLKRGSLMMLRAVAKYKYFLVIPVIIALALGGWQYTRVQSDKDWKQATDDYRRADYDSAAKILSDKKVPNDPERLGVYAQTMLATRQLDKAIPAYEKLYEVKKDPFTKVVLGNIYNEQKKYDEAEKVYQSVISDNPTYVQSYVNLATMYKLQGKNDKAIETAEAGIKANPTNTILHELLVSLTMEDKNSQKFKDAVAKLKEVNPKDPLLELVKQ